ncbi:MAG: hypothetical protein KC777_20350 [Cyanobacteria bacterium HKST-UBA02]|nr:hypothetical protein [Cyanobacteria bacterium HKST-UBA02]
MRRNGHSLIEVAISVFLLIICALILLNVFVIARAKFYNDRVCRDCIQLAVKAALDGKDTQSVIKAARSGMESCGRGGNWVEHPQFTMFNDDISENSRVLQLQTTTRVLIAVPFLVASLPGAEKDDGRHLKVRSTYVYKIKNPKRIETGARD